MILLTVNYLDRLKFITLSDYIKRIVTFMEQKEPKRSVKDVVIVYKELMNVERINTELKVAKSLRWRMETIPIEKNALNMTNQSREFVTLQKKRL